MTELKGRPPLFNEPEELDELFQEYKAWVKKNPLLVHDFVGKDGLEVHRKRQRPLTYDGFCTFAYREKKMTIHHYFDRKEGHYENFGEICRAIKQEIRSDQIDGGMASIYNPSITQRLNGLTEKISHEGGDKPIFMNLDTSDLDDEEIPENGENE